MNVKQLKEALAAFPDEMEVVLFDGYECIGYRGDWEIKEFEGTVDIGIGGTQVGYEYQGEEDENF